MYTIEYNNEIKTFLHPVKSAGISIHAGIIEASTQYDYHVHVNQRHAHIRNLPEKYAKYPRYITVREPHKWYRSFYRFFMGVEGYLSWAITDPKPDGCIYPIDPNEFVRRMINMKDTLIKFPNKARVFRNLLRSQGNMHFVTAYFENDFHPEDEKSMEQFNMSLYDWFMKNAGIETAHLIPMNRLDVVEKLFNIQIPHLNATPSNKPNVEFNEETLELIRNTHSQYYDIIENFDENNIRHWDDYNINRFKEEK